MTVRPRRSVLYMPGSNARALEKARELPADGLILDLEDAVAPEAKAAARDAVVKAVSTGFGDREVLVRMNGLDTRWWVEDLDAVAAARPDAVLVPKISDPGQLQDLAARIVDIGTDPRVRVWAMMETPLAMLNVGASAAAARAYGLDILDGVYNDLGDAEGFVAECQQASDLGFDGKTLIHPRQIEPCNAAFSPSTEEVVTARKMIAAFELPENKDKGVIQIDGRMVERLHAEMARRTVAIADAIEKARPKQPA